MHAVNLSAKQKAHEFLNQADYFNLGHILTEQAHPKTTLLSELVIDSIPDAIELLKEIDLDALKTFSTYIDGITHLQQAIQQTFADGGRVFLCGCGATGRLALYLEYLWRTLKNDDRVIAFMAGGDIALVHSLEGFEDFPEYGAMHLQQLGFSQNDLLISCTEGGETPFVIGATERAAKLSKYPCYFLYCNPDEQLQKITRCKQILANNRVIKLNLTVGPMALAGSTRMQASTVLQLAVGMALFIDAQNMQAEFSKFYSFAMHNNFEFLSDFIYKEAECYIAGDYITYLIDDYGITTLTDLTERSPTFSLQPIDNLQGQPKHHSLYYFAQDNTSHSLDAWQKLLGRKPRFLDWPRVHHKTRSDYLFSFDFSLNAINKRKQMLPQSSHHLFEIRKYREELVWHFGKYRHALDISGLIPLFEHTFLKMLLNIHSTLTMGRLHRYRHNLMTYVKPTNGKLIDRAARYIIWLLKIDADKDFSYEDVIYEIFYQSDRLSEDDSIVMRVYNQLKNKKGGRLHRTNTTLRGKT